MKARKRIPAVRIHSELVEEVIELTKSSTIRDAADFAAEKRIPFEIAHRVILKPNQRRRFKRIKI